MNPVLVLPHAPALLLMDVIDSRAKGVDRRFFLRYRRDDDSLPAVGFSGKIPMLARLTSISDQKFDGLRLISSPSEKLRCVWCPGLGRVSETLRRVSSLEIWKGGFPARPSLAASASTTLFLLSCDEGGSCRVYNGGNSSGDSLDKLIILALSRMVSGAGEHCNELPESKLKSGSFSEETDSSADGDVGERECADPSAGESRC